MRAYSRGARLARLCTLATVLLLGAAASAQVPYIPPEEYQQYRRLQGDKISFCIWGPNPTAEFDRAVATELAHALLLEPEFHTHEPDVALAEPQFWETVLILLTEHCSVLAGFNIISGGYPDWLIPSRPYYRAPFTFVATSDDYRTLLDVPRESILGSKLFTAADHQLSRYLGSLPEEERWRRFPYTQHDLLFRHLRDGVIEAALVWSPILYEHTEGDPESSGLYPFAMAPLPTVHRQLGFVVRQDDVYLQSLLDGAIRSLIEDGVITRLIDEFKIPGEASHLE